MRTVRHCIDTSRRLKRFSWTVSDLTAMLVLVAFGSASAYEEEMFRLTTSTIYVASYHANNGHYSCDVNYFTGKGMDHPPLHAPANGVWGGNGVYAYGANSVFPRQTWNAANYYVDVMFQAASPSPPPNLMSVRKSEVAL